jgi:hypothetical protein
VRPTVIPKDFGPKLPADRKGPGWYEKIDRDSVGEKRRRDASATKNGRDSDVGTQFGFWEWVWVRVSSGPLMGVRATKWTGMGPSSEVLFLVAVRMTFH